MTEIWKLFPYPTMTSDGLTGGSLVDIHPQCAGCRTRPCLEAAQRMPVAVELCPWGIAYARIDEERVINGMVVNDVTTLTLKARKRFRAEPGRRTTSPQMLRAVNTARALGPGVVTDYQQLKDAILARIDQNPELLAALADELRKEFEENLNQSHDFLQLVKLVRGHAETLLHARYPQLAPEDAATKLPTEGAIYFATELMLVKMDSMVFLNEINRALGGESRFEAHRFLLKYLRIYRWQAEQKGLDIQLVGECRTPCWYNSGAIGAVIQGLMDNLAKYAPPRSKATVRFDESATSVRITFSSLGPRIEPEEAKQIFLPKYRAKAARAVETGGMGIGLATAKQISDALGLQLSFRQDGAEDPAFPARFATEFSFVLERAS